MKVLLTGLNGTLAPVVARHLEQHGATVVPWNRQEVPSDDRQAAERFLDTQRPDWFLHLATGSPDWAETVAELACKRGIRFLFTSSVSVFDGSRSGPFGIEHPLDAQDDYGRYKIECEQRVSRAHPEAFIARLGWQIGQAPGSNTMTDFLCRAMAEHGRIEASDRWLPSCSFLEDTATSLHELMKAHPPGTYQLEGNPGLSFYQIARGLQAFGKWDWVIVPGEEPDRDIRMQDQRIRVAPLSRRLPLEPGLQ